MSTPTLTHFPPTPTKKRLDNVRRVLGYYASQPSRYGELAVWAQHRGKSPLELAYPWWNYQAVRAVERVLSPGAVVFEFGGGGSTLWLSGKGARCTCVEDDSAWVEVLRKTLPASCAIMSRPASPTGSIGSEVTPGKFYDDYVHSIDTQPDASLDLVVVDGRARVACAGAAMAKVRPGGVLLLDDSDRPRYAAVGASLHNWTRTDYRGAKAGGGGIVQSSLFVRPA